MSKPVAFVLIFAFFFSCSFVVYEQLDGNINTRTLVVQKNDTLWEIAEKLDYNRDVGYVVKRIRELNDLVDCRIYPGQELMVPYPGQKMLGLTDDKNNKP